MRWTRWIPEEARAAPSRPIELRYAALAPVFPSDAGRLLEEAAVAAGLSVLSTSGGSWTLGLPWRTNVYGVIGRDVVERVRVDLETDPERGVGILLHCLPVASHSAHAAGLAGVLAFAVAGWLLGGLVRGLPVGFTALIGGWLWVTFTRQLAMQALERRLRHVAELLGTALWPGVPAQLLPVPRPMV
ncbi:MAG TPA: hypothetical protein ENK19_00400 [Acidobacteria bacterium]|nr:hypothetical protein [Acidobacteriota bacterium]